MAGYKVKGQGVMDKTITSKSASAVLEKFLTEGLLASQYLKYLEAQIGMGQSRYNRIRTGRGEAAAKKWLDRTIIQTRMGDLAAAIEPVAQGVLDLARSDSEGLFAHVLEPSSNDHFPRSPDIFDEAAMVAVFNPPFPGHGCPKPAGFDDWHRRGLLGLKAVTLEVGYTRSGGAVAQLGLVLPMPSLFSENSILEGYTVVAIDLYGKTSVRTRSIAFLEDALLVQELGLSNLRGKSWAFPVIGLLEEVVPSSNPADYLASAMKDLGPYFTGMAGILSAQDKSLPPV